MSSNTLVIWVLVIVGASFVLITVTVNDWFIDIIPSVTVATTLCIPTSLFAGIPDILLFESNDNHDGLVGTVNVKLSLTSTSLAVNI